VSENRTDRGWLVFRIVFWLIMAVIIEGLVLYLVIDEIGD
jgi:hypothetical protein